MTSKNKYNTDSQEKGEMPDKRKYFKVGPSMGRLTKDNLRITCVSLNVEYNTGAQKSKQKQKQQEEASLVLEFIVKGVTLLNHCYSLKTSRTRIITDTTLGSEWLVLATEAETWFRKQTLQDLELLQRNDEKTVRRSIHELTHRLNTSIFNKFIKDAEWLKERKVALKLLKRVARKELTTYCLKRKIMLERMKDQYRYGPDDNHMREDPTDEMLKQSILLKAKVRVDYADVINRQFSHREQQMLIFHLKYRNASDFVLWHLLTQTVSVKCTYDLFLVDTCKSR